MRWGSTLGVWAAEGVVAKRAKTEYRWGAPTSPGLAPWAQEGIPGGAGFSRVAADGLLPPTLQGAKPGRAAGLMDYQPQHRFLALLATADGSAVASWGPLSAQGRWVLRWKDKIDRRFLQQFKR